MRMLHLLLVGSLAATLCAATYYLDSAGGNDSNASITEQSAWQTLQKVNTTNFHHGDRVLFQSGSEWRGQLVPKVTGMESRHSSLTVTDAEPCHISTGPVSSKTRFASTTFNSSKFEIWR